MYLVVSVAPREPPREDKVKNSKNAMRFPP
jgi:hypothetical protein